MGGAWVRVWRTGWVRAGCRCVSAGWVGWVGGGGGASGQRVAQVAQPRQWRDVRLNCSSNESGKNDTSVYLRKEGEGGDGAQRGEGEVSSEGGGGRGRW